MNRSLFGLLMLLFLLTACDNELNVRADYEDLTVLYAILDPKEDTNYIRVQRAYLGDAPASASYNETDSLYYDTADIQVLIRTLDSDNGQVLGETPLVFDQSVALNQNGPFTTEGHYLYRLPNNFDLNRANRYQVAVIRSDGSEAEASTGLVGNINIRIPVANPLGRVFDGRIRFNPDQASATMIAFQPIIYFHYREYNLATGDSAYKTEEIRLPLQENSFGEISLVLSSSEFTTALGGRIEADEDVIRFFEGIDITIWGAAEELVTYFQLNEPSTGINQNRPDFTQVSNGTGLVSSRTSSTREDVDLERNRYFPDLRFSDATCDLQFVEVKAGRDTCFCRNGQEFCL